MAEEIALNNILNVVIHDLSRADGGFEVDYGDSALVVTETMQRLVDQLSVLYAKRSGKSHGKFEDDVINYPVQGYLKKYFVDMSCGFYDMSVDMMGTLRVAAQGTASTGGHVFIAHIEKDGRHYLLVVILNDELGAAITGDKDVEDSVYLDIKGFRLAGRVDLSNWSAGGEKYLSFLKGKGQDRVSDYFKVFLGCDNTVAAFAETNNLIKVLEAFALEEALDDDAKDAFLRSAYAICKRLSDTDTPFDSGAFSNELWPEDPAKLSVKLAEDESNISDGFVPDKRPLRRLIKFVGSTSFWKVEFDRRAITQRQIIFDSESETITISGLPEELLARLQAEYAEDDA